MNMGRNNRVAEKTELFRMNMTGKQLEVFNMYLEKIGMTKTKFLTIVLERVIKSHQEVLKNV